MTRDALTRMDVDTGWVYHRKFRALQRSDPDGWPSAAVAWFALLGEAWRSANPDLTLAEAWPPALRADEAQVTGELLRAGLITEAGQIPRDSWDEWTEPARVRMEKARNAAAKRWQSPGNAQAMPSAIPSIPSIPRSRASAGSNGATTPPVDMKAAMASAGFDAGSLMAKGVVKGDRLKP